jgi:hypothetical protein
LLEEEEKILRASYATKDVQKKKMKLLPCHVSLFAARYIYIIISEVLYPSYAWRSVCQARKVLEDGLLWRVGNGESIKIWSDKWLSSSFSHKVHTPIRGLDGNARVSDIIDSGTGWWNISLIRSIFDPGEADLICGIPLSPLRNLDKLIWQGTSHGFFIVKSAYHAEKQRRSSAEGESSKAVEDSTLWRKIWSIPGPAVLKNFIWKMCQKILPTKANLFHKRIVSDPLCPWCTTET